jgi:hypothetical protein
MNMQLLSSVMLPPTCPSEAGDPQRWPEIEERVGSALPIDYKEYICLYGTGSIAGFLWVFNPFTEREPIDLVSQVPKVLGALRTLRAKWGDRECPYPLFPESHGLLPWGVSDNGDWLFWETIGAPDEWTVVVNETRSSVYEHFYETMSGFLYRLVTGSLASRIFPPGLSREFPVFEAYSPHAE